MQFSVTQVHAAKQTIRKNAAQTDRPTKLLVAEAVIGMKLETVRYVPWERWQD